MTINIKQEDLHKLKFKPKEFEILDSFKNNKYLFCTFKIKLVAQYQEYDHFFYIAIRLSSEIKRNLLTLCRIKKSFKFEYKDGFITVLNIPKPSFCVIPKKLRWEKEEKEPAVFVSAFLPYLNIVNNNYFNIINYINENFKMKLLKEVKKNEKI